ncbi:Ribonuclease I precursor [Thalassovita gelatinovora]|uniref:Ribonuclease I n=1 Tax=Thalassovita gelatinovora TaxID=53501 RepID=A0A0P1FDL3_THAGE|nr:ribonuclease T2 [Thalassovita gelatinovora]CUH66181.1 Ribonuclease I precursor [Thalassovita gelatinovora]SEQ21362.1 ribonuclease T2 [Thalassovita gelatinovora]
MRKRLLSLIFTLVAAAASAEDDRPGAFDYYVLSLSWSPSWCALEGDARRSPQCNDNADYGWVLHGLWPQYHRGWPSYCRTTQPHPTRQMSAEMADIMGSSGLAWYQWKKHGVCSGLTAAAYYDLARRAYDSLTRPAIFRKLDRPVTLPAKVVEDAFLKANPDLEPDMLTITCKDGRIQEARLCLSKTLTPVPCGRDIVKDCSLKNALFDPIR